MAQRRTGPATTRRSCDSCCRSGQLHATRVGIRQIAEKIAAQIPVALARATVTVPADPDGEPLVGAGLAQTRVLRVFTDDEAFSAWAEERAPGELVPTPLAVGDSRSLDSLVDASSPTTLVLNPSRPGRAWDIG